MKALNEEEGEYEIGLTPLIDVAFLLLVFFLVSTSFVRREEQIDVKLPRATESTGSTQESETVVVNVLETGMMQAGGRILQGSTELVDLLKKAHEANPNIKVIIRGDEDARHRYVVRALNAALKAGIGDTSIAVFDTQSE